MNVVAPLWLLACIVYFLPPMVAGVRGHHQTAAIGVLTFFLGWTVIGWVAALVWACTAVRRNGC